MPRGVAVAVKMGEEIVFDRRGARTSPLRLVDVRRERFRSVWHALQVRHLLTLKKQGQCTLGKLDGRGGRFDPIALDAAIANISDWLADLDDVAKDALALELLYPTMPIDHGSREPSPKRPRVESRCDVLERRHGGEWYDRRYHSVVTQACRAIEARMVAAGVLGDDPA